MAHREISREEEDMRKEEEEKGTDSNGGERTAQRGVKKDKRKDGEHKRKIRGKRNGAGEEEKGKEEIM